MRKYIFFFFPAFSRFPLQIFPINTHTHTHTHSLSLSLSFCSELFQFHQLTHTHTCSPGLWWTKDQSYKNAITNQLALQGASKLYYATGNTTYLTQAKMVWSWFKSSGMINNQSLINDGLNSDCTSNHQTTWTYNQGVILVGLALLHNATGDESALDMALSIANATITTLVDKNGVLTEPTSELGMDGQSFKGIFVRNLAQFTLMLPKSGDDHANNNNYNQLYQHSRRFHHRPQTQQQQQQQQQQHTRALSSRLQQRVNALRPAFEHFIGVNAATMLSSDRTSDGMYGGLWQGPVDPHSHPPQSNGTSPLPQTSAIDLLNAALFLGV